MGTPSIAMPSSVPKWVRVLAFALVLAAAAGTAGWAYSYFTRPAVLKVAVGSVDGEAVRLVSAIAGRLGAVEARVRLKVVEVGAPLAASEALASGAADLAVVRADIGEMSKARAIAVLTYGVVLLMTPPDSRISSVEELKGKTLGLVGGDINRKVFDMLDREYQLSAAKTRVRPVALGEAKGAILKRQIDAVLVVAPVSEEYLSRVRGRFKSGKKSMDVLAIDSAEAIANANKAFESYEMPKGTIQGSPAVPDEDLTTLRVPFLLVASTKLKDDYAGELTKVLIEARQALAQTYPLMAHVGAPETEKDAFIPAHAGTLAYLEGEQKTFLDKYGDALYYGPLALGGIASLLAGVWKAFGLSSDTSNETGPVAAHAMTSRVARAETRDDLNQIEEDLDRIIMEELAQPADERNASALTLAARRLERLIDLRRAELENKPPRQS